MLRVQEAHVLDSWRKCNCEQTSIYLMARIFAVYGELFWEAVFGGKGELCAYTLFTVQVHAHGVIQWQIQDFPDKGDGGGDNP